jgi:hypothetical protein
MQYDYSKVVLNHHTKQKESAIYAFLILFGIVGLLYLHFDLTNNKSTAVDADNYKAFITTNSSVASVAPQQEAAQSVFMSMVSKEKLFVPNDYLEAELPAFFSLKNVSNGVTYELDLGEGHRKPFVNGKVMHTYQDHKTVNVTLYGTFEGETKKIQEREYEVSRPAEVEVAASVVDYSSNQ